MTYSAIDNCGYKEGCEKNLGNEDNKPPITCWVEVRPDKHSIPNARVNSLLPSSEVTEVIVKYQPKNGIRDSYLNISYADQNKGPVNVYGVPPFWNTTQDKLRNPALEDFEEPIRNHCFEYVLPTPFRGNIRAKN